jgi:hypothetical protein
VGDERSTSELGRNVDDLRREVREDYVRKDVYLEARDADRARIKRLEDGDTSDRAHGKSWVIGIGLAVVGAGLGVLAQLLNARGH